MLLLLSSRTEGDGGLTLLMSYFSSIFHFMGRSFFNFACPLNVSFLSFFAIWVANFSFVCSGAFKMRLNAPHPRVRNEMSCPIQEAMVTAVPFKVKALVSDLP